MRRLATILVLFPALSAYAYQKADEPSPEPPPPEPIALKVVGDKTITIDRMGMKPADYRAAVQAGRVAAIPTGLKLRITNNLKVPLRVRVTGSVPTLTMTLKGPEDALTYMSKPPPRVGISYQIVQPGKHLELPIGTLTNYGGIGVGAGMTNLYPTKAGEWTMTATYTTALYLVNATGGFVLYKNTTRTTLKAPVVRLTVKEK